MNSQVLPLLSTKQLQLIHLIIRIQKVLFAIARFYSYFVFFEALFGRV